jgi:G:T-mismatch repair DNA endonuclease (very short patch repair protein)
MAKLYLYQAVDIVTQKEKKVLFLCGRWWTTHDVNGFKTFH